MAFTLTVGPAVKVVVGLLEATVDVVVVTDVVTTFVVDLISGAYIFVLDQVAFLPPRLGGGGEESLSPCKNFK